MSACARSRCSASADRTNERGGGRGRIGALSPEVAPLLVITGAAWLLALLFVWLGMRAARRRRDLLDTPTSKTQGVFIGDVELSGASECSTPVRSFLAEISCVHYEWSVGEHWRRTVVESYTDSKGNRRTRTRIESGVATIASGGEMVPFFLRDDTGAVLVRPQGARIEPAIVFSRDCGPGDPLYYAKARPEAVRDSVHRRTFRESAIPLGVKLFVLGRARERADVVAPEIAAHPDARDFLISTRDEKAISSGFRVATWAWSIAGFIVASLGSLFAIAQARVEDGLLMAALIAGAVLAFCAMVGLVWTWMTYNSLAMLRQRVRRAWANVDVELRRRHDLLPPLVEVVKGARGHEAETLRAIAGLRAQIAAGASDPRGATGRVAGVAPQLRVLVEAVPELQTNENFLALQHELVATETRIALARTYYNGLAAGYNARIVVVPERFLAAVGGLRAAPFFEAQGFERAAVAVRLAS